MLSESTSDALGTTFAGTDRPMRFDSVDATLRRFLTTGIPYCGYPGNGNAMLWEAFFYQSPSGRLTGRGYLYIDGKVCPPKAAAAKPTAGKK